MNEHRREAEPVAGAGEERAMPAATLSLAAGLEDCVVVSVSSGNCSPHVVGFFAPIGVKGEYYDCEASATVRGAKK